MRKSFLTTVFELIGFGTVGFVLIVWFLGRGGESSLPGLELHESGKLQSGLFDEGGQRDAAGSISAYELDDPGYATEGARGSREYKGVKYRKPESVSNRLSGRSASEASAGQERRSGSSAVSGRPADAVRSWKGVHRDEDFAWTCYQRFGEDIMNLSEEFGLHPQVFLARVIAYSYDFVENPKRNPGDNNFTALKRPGNKERAVFSDPYESLKAYAVVNAGEVTRLSAEGAVAKHDRAWTMNKLIEEYAFISDLQEAVVARADYNGLIGPANEVSEEENYQRELVGETIRLTARVDDKVKERQAKEAGYDDWESYLDALPEGQRQRQEEEAAGVTSAVLHKKALNLSRRVNAKKRDKQRSGGEIVLSEDK